MPTATTYYKKHKISKGETVAQSLKERFDYGQNPDKTEGGELISSYGCDHMTADAEFLLSKAKYKAATGREQRRDADVLCYQIRQSFKPGEITPEEANRIGYETAMRWTKGKYAFFVATHTDKAHIHNHIYYNSTSLDCTRKFRDFIGSGRAVRRLSDRICLENDLSVITDPKLHSKGRFLHYGAWLGAERQPSYKEQLRLAINETLAKCPADFDAFLRLMEASGFTVKWARRCDLFSCSGAGAGDQAAGVHPRGRLRSREHQGRYRRGAPNPGAVCSCICCPSPGQSDRGYRGTAALW